MSVDVINLRSNIKDYIAIFPEDNSFLQEINQEQHKIFIIDQTVDKLYASKCLNVLGNAEKIIFKVHETSKNIHGVIALYDQVMKFQPKKNTTIISIGGGIMQDLSGDVASTLFRGVKWIFIPTTLLAQADSCIGAKTSLNYKKYKNLMGTFYPPNTIYIYPNFLQTQNETDYYSGVGEVAKLLLMGGEDATQFFLKHLAEIKKRDFLVLSQIIKKCLLIKKAYIEEDEFDMGKRNMLNFGHCFGHALETATNFIVPHGQAVVLGIILANYIAEKRNVLSAKKREYLQKNILTEILKIDINSIKINLTEVIAAMKKDKKRIGQDLPLIMLNDNYEMLKINDLKETEVEYALKKIGWL